MSKKRYFDTNFWSDTWVDTLSHDEKLFFIYLITNDRTTIAGVYEVPLKRMAFETDFNKTQITTMFERMKNKVRYIDGWVVLRNSIKSQNYKNEKIRLGIKSILESCPVQLLQFISFPQDLDIIIERPEPEPKQQGLFDDTPMTHDDSSMSHDKYNIIKYNINTNTNTNPPDKPSASGVEKKVLSKTEKRNYAIAMNHERQQHKNAKKATERKSSSFDKVRVDLR